MNEYGLFNDEGLVEGQFYSRTEAEAGMSAYDDDDELHVGEICPDHAEQEKATCEECAGEDDE